MDLQLYYQKIRETEAGITDEYPLMVSVETTDGGKAGTKTETPRRLAAKLIVEGQARQATQEESEAFRKAIAEGKLAADTATAAARLQLTVLPAAELDRLRSEARSYKD